MHSPMRFSSPRVASCAPRRRPRFDEVPFERSGTSLKFRFLAEAMYLMALGN